MGRFIRACAYTRQNNGGQARAKNQGVA